MNVLAAQMRSVLPVEDNPGDAELLATLLGDVAEPQHRIRHVATPREAIAQRPVESVDAEEGRAHNLLRAINHALARMREMAGRRRADALQARLVATVGAPSDAIVGMTPAGIIITWNRGAEVIFGYTHGRPPFGQASVSCRSVRHAPYDKNLGTNSGGLVNGPGGPRSLPRTAADRPGGARLPAHRRARCSCRAGRVARGHAKARQA